MLDKTTIIKKWRYLYLLNQPDNIISIFDELHYDRSDIDMVSPAMRQYVIEMLETQGFKQLSGNVVVNNVEDVQCIIPKFHALGSSPFDIIRYTPKRQQDFYILTPTQTACQFIDHYEHEKAVENICQLIEQQPINLFKLMDYLENKKHHLEFKKKIYMIKEFQNTAINNQPLKNRRSLG